MNITLLDETLEMARRTQLSIAQICRAIEVTPRWYHKVLSGETPDPSVRRIQRLHDYLAANEPQIQKIEVTNTHPTQGAA